jgi:3',5'-cyclic AMP phosphodiesterase CpdA
MRALLFFFLTVTASASERITALYLSWYDNPTTTMTIQWHSDLEEDAIHYQRTDGQKVTHLGAHHLFPNENIFIHSTTLTALEPDTEYTFQINDESLSYTFRTAPASLSSPLRFIIGGDLYLSPKLFRKMSKTLLKLDPLFAVLGGDLAYAIGHFCWSSPSRRWRNFLADWKETLIGPNNRLIPFLVVPGNHDIAPDHYELFFSLFAFPQKELYRAVDFGSYLSLILLDTGHFQPIEGRQTLWLKTTLASRNLTPYLFTIYHIGAYPSHYPYDGETPKKIRGNWCPLFDQYGVQAAFEHHSHTYKKTYPLKAEARDREGVLYFGDGCWGVPPRKTFDRWYLDKRARGNNAYFIELNSQSALIKAVGLNGEILDETEITAKTDS